MTNNAVHQSLIELEENLKEVASARKQVQSIAQDSEKLIAAVSKLVKDVEKLRLQYADAAKGITGELSSGVKQFTTALGGQMGSVEEVVAETAKRSEATASRFTGSLSAIQKGVEGALAASTISFQQQLDQGASDMLNQSRQLFDKSRQSLDSLSDRITSLESSLTGLKDRIDNTDFSRALDAFHRQLMALSNNIADLSAESKSRDELVLNHMRKQAKDADMRFKLILVGLVVIALLGVAKLFIK